MIALIILGYAIDGASFIAGVLAAYVFSACALIFGIWFAINWNERNALPEGVEEGTYGEPGPKFGREG